MAELSQGVGIVETALTQEPPFWETFEQISIDNWPVWVLGRAIEKAEGVDELKQYIRSRFWFTYRKNFSPIGGIGPTSDQGWGCMLRCAQMLLGETLLRRHIQRHFKWNIDDKSDVYERILAMFFDEKDALYSLHQIAQMGVCEGKAISEWFGPNTAAQVLKKLTIFDEWSNIAVHVALDNILVRDDAVTMATTYPPEDAVKLIMENGKVDKTLNKERNGSSSDWRPLLIMIPLRLGLTSINECYLSAIQGFFKIPQCVGIIGGRPNHALYFVGVSGSKLFYLDPHYCRPKTATTAKPFTEQKKTTTKEAPAAEARSDDDGFSKLEDLEPLPSQTSDFYTKMDDATYHCQMLLWMEYESIDPSLALAMFCETRENFDELCENLKKNVLPSSKPPMFELLDRRPSYWPPFEPYMGVNMKIELKEFDEIENRDDDFEVLEL
ncbi:unnamed protein product [Caenorhabditis bovis]|uniref:Cysteine protease n=1 Tax=Caenorhabditis bovis TaxID=2654633 RepID=A0A8S1F9Q2_9PELO|nr:unnamed protein product [Caenorhabditis bovis]